MDIDFELIDKIAVYISKLSVAKAILYNNPRKQAREHIKRFTSIDIDELEKQLK